MKNEIFTKLGRRGAALWAGLSGLLVQLCLMVLVVGFLKAGGVEGEPGNLIAWVIPWIGIGYLVIYVIGALYLIAAVYILAGSRRAWKWVLIGFFLVPNMLLVGLVGFSLLKYGELASSLNSLFEGDTTVDVIGFILGVIGLIWLVIFRKSFSETKVKINKLIKVVLIAALVLEFGVLVISIGSQYLQTYFPSYNDKQVASQVGYRLVLPNYLPDGYQRKNFVLSEQVIEGHQAVNLSLRSKQLNENFESMSFLITQTYTANDINLRMFVEDRYYKKTQSAFKEMDKLSYKGREVYIVKMKSEKGLALAITQHNGYVFIVGSLGGDFEKAVKIAISMVDQVDQFIIDL